MILEINLFIHFGSSIVDYFYSAGNNVIVNLVHCWLGGGKRMLNKEPGFSEKHGFFRFLC
jgi:hypothetical protein